MTLAETYTKAAEIIKERGWTTADESDDPWGLSGGPCCIEGGLSHALSLGPHKLQETPAYRYLQAYIASKVSWMNSPLTVDPYRPLYRFNDFATTTEKDVMNALLGAAAKARKEGI